MHEGTDQLRREGVQGFRAVEREDEHPIVTLYEKAWAHDLLGSGRRRGTPASRLSRTSFDAPGPMRARGSSEQNVATDSASCRCQTVDCQPPNRYGGAATPRTARGASSWAPCPTRCGGGRR